MFCPKCGTQIADNAVTCTSCGASLAAPRVAAGGAAADKMKAASTDAMGAFKTFASNPVGGLAPAYESLGPNRALGVGITFGVVFALCALFGMYRFVSAMFGGFGGGGGVGAGGFLRLIVIAVVPFVSVFGASAGVRMIFGGSGSFGSDSFMAGASLLPIGIVALLAALLGPSNYNVVTSVALFAGCFTVLMLFAGLTRICKISERAATLAVPLIVAVSLWLSKVIYGAMLRSSMGM